MSRPVRRWCAVLAFVAFVVAVEGLQAQRRRGGGATDTPLSTNTILANPDAFVGKAVSLSAGVEQVLSGSVFVVDQRRMVGPAATEPLGRPLLIVAPRLTALPGKGYLRIKGQLVTFNPGAIEKAAPGYVLDATPDALARFSGQPVLVATSVMSATAVELVGKP